MPFADTDGSTLKFVEETNFGQTPANSTAWKTPRVKSWSIKPIVNSVESEELSANVDVLDSITVAKMGNFTLGGEYAKDATFEALLECLFRSTFTTNVLKGGILKKSLTLEERIMGTAAEFGTLQGARIDTFSMSGSNGRIIETSFGGMGSAVAYGATSAVGTGTLAAAGTNRGLSLADLTAFTLAGDATSLTVLEFALQVANSTREQYGAGSTSLQGIGYGTRRISGSFSAYFETREQLTKFAASTKSDLSFVLTDGTNSHTWRLPAVKFTDGERAVGGRSTDIVQRFDFLATYNVAQATTAMVTRTP